MITPIDDRARRSALAVLALCLASACGSSEGSAKGDLATAHITVDSTRKFQVMTGWEATAQAGQTAIANFPAIRDSLARLAVHDLGITRLRLEVRSGLEQGPGRAQEASARCRRYLVQNDNDDPFVENPAGFRFAELDNTIENVVKPMQRELQAAGEKLFLNVNYVSFMPQCPGGSPYAHGSPEEYAEFVLATYRYLRDRHGLVPDAWEVILEPENTHYWRGREIGTSIMAAARRLEQHGFAARFIAPSTTKAANAPRYFADMLEVPGLLPYIGEFAYHRYRGTSGADIAMIGEFAAEHKLKTAMLEHIGSGHADLHQDLKVGNVSAWQQFALAYPAKDDNGAQYFLLADAQPAPQIRLSATGRYLRQYFRYIRPGAIRLGAATDNPNVDPVAFVNPRGGQVLVLKTARAAQVTVSGLSPGTYDVRFTTADKSDVAVPSITTKGGRVTLAVPAAGVMTLFTRRS